MRRFLQHPFWLAVALVLVTGCASPAERVLTSVNAYHYWLGEYETTCAGKGTEACRAWETDLRSHKARLEAAEAAIKRGGKLPLQLKAMRAAERQAGRR